MKPTIGILGGMGPESSAKFYEVLIEKAQARRIESNTEFPHIILESIPGPLLFGKNPDLSTYKKAISNLESAGADFIVIVCNTACIFQGEFQKLVKIPILDLQKEVEKELKKQGISKVVVFGSSQTMSKLFKFTGIEAAKVSDEDAKAIDKIIANYCAGINKEEQSREFLRITEKYNPAKIVIACTELSCIMKNAKRKDYIDTFDILLDAAFNKWKNS